jgi:hypothetical protein
MKVSFLDCKHINMQSFTECCLDCGYNVYTTKAQYLADLQRQVDDADPVVKNIRFLEKKLGIGK